MGVLPWWTRLTLWFTQVPWLAAVIVVILAFLVAHLDAAMAARQGAGRAEDDRRLIAGTGLDRRTARQ